MYWKLLTASGILFTLLGLVGCQSQPPTPSSDVAGQIQATLAGLDDADRLVAEAQAYCAVQTHRRLGSMGVPLKLEVGGQTVFICCKGCEKKALADPQATLARVEKLKTQQ